MDDGEYGIMRIWKPEFLMAPRITDKVTLNDPFDVVNAINDVYRVLPRRVVDMLPSSIDLKYLVVRTRRVAQPRRYEGVPVRDWRARRD